MNHTSVTVGRKEEYSVTQRVTVVAWRLAQGGSVTVSEVADELGMSPSGAYRLLDKMSAAAPITYDQQTRQWKKF